MASALPSALAAQEPSEQAAAAAQELIHVSAERSLAPPSELRPATPRPLTVVRKSLTASEARIVSDGIYSTTALGPMASNKIDLLGLERVIAAEALNERRPALAHNPNAGEYLLVYERVSVGPTGADIYGLRLLEDGTPIGAPFAIMAEPGEESDPQVAYSSIDDEYMVVAVIDDALGTEVITRTVSGSGVPTSVILAPFSDTDRELGPAVIFNGSSGEFLVACHGFEPDGTTDIYLQRMTAGNGLGAGAVFGLFNNGVATSEAQAALAYEPISGEYWIVYQVDFHNDFSDVDLYGLKAPSDLSVATDIFSVAALTSGGVARRELNPSVVWNVTENHFLVTFEFDKHGDYSDLDVYAIRKTFGNATVGGLLALGTTSVSEMEPKAIYQDDLGEYQVLWEADNQTSPGGVRFGGLAAAGVPLPSLSSSGLGTGPVALAGNTQTSVAVWEVIAGGLDLHSRWLGNAAPVLTIDPTSVDFGDDSNILEVELHNTGRGLLTWGSTAPVWMGLDPGSGSFFADQVVAITPDRSLLLPGTTQETLTVTSDGGDVDVLVSVQVVNEAPDMPVLVAPADGAGGQGPTLIVDWTATDPNTVQPLTFDVYLSDDAALVTAKDPSVRIASGLTVSQLLTSPGYGTTYSWRVAVSDGALTTDGPVWTFTTVPVAAPTPVLPAGTVRDARPVFLWTAAGGAASYRLQVATDIGFSSLVLDLPGLVSTSYTPTADLADGIYYYRVAGLPSSGAAGPYSATGTFTVDTSPPPAPILEPIPSPSSHREPTFSWSVSAGASFYTLAVARDLAFTDLVFDFDTVSTTFTSGSLSEGTYYWKVFSTDGFGTPSADSEIGTFIIDITPPGVPFMHAQPSRIGETRPTLSWSPVAGATEYYAEVSLDAFASQLANSGWIADTSWTVNTDLAEGTVYWRVRARDGAGNVGFVAGFQSFFVDATPPPVPTLSLISSPTAQRRPWFRWTYFNPFVDYHFQLATDDQFTSAAQAGEEPRKNAEPENDSQGKAMGSLLYDIDGVGDSRWLPTEDLPEGRLFWRVASIDDTGNKSAFSAPMELIIDITAPDVPTLTAVSPDPTTSRRPVLAWEAISDGTWYQVQVSTTAAFSSLLVDTMTLGTSYTPTSDLADGTFYWRVRVRDQAGNFSSYSTADSFEVDATTPGVPVLIAVNPDPTTVRRPTLSWGAVSGTTAYRLQVSTSPTFVSLILDSELNGTTWTPLVDLPEGTIYWRASARDVAGNASAFSAVDSFEIDVTAPDVPSLTAVSPDPTMELRPALSWSAVADAGEYQVQVSTDSGFAGTLFDVTTSRTSFTPTSDLPEDTIYWRVSSSDALGNTSAFSAADSFEIDVTPPGVPSLTAVNPDPTTELRPVLSWSAVSGASDYQVQVSTDSGFATTLFDLTTAGTSWTPTSDLPEGMIYWRVASRDALGNTSAFSAADSFEIDVTAPGAPILTPVNPDPTTELRPVLSWSAVSGASDYQVQVSSDSGFSSTLFDLTTSVNARAITPFPKFGSPP